MLLEGVDQSLSVSNLKNQQVLRHFASQHFFVSRIFLVI